MFCPVSVVPKQESDVCRIGAHFLVTCFYCISYGAQRYTIRDRCIIRFTLVHGCLLAGGCCRPHRRQHGGPVFHLHNICNCDINTQINSSTHPQNSHLIIPRDWPKGNPSLQIPASGVFQKLHFLLYQDPAQPRKTHAMHPTQHTFCHGRRHEPEEETVGVI